MIEEILISFCGMCFTFILGYTLRSTHTDEVFEQIRQYNVLKEHNEMETLKDINNQLMMELNRVNQENRKLKGDLNE